MHLKDTISVKVLMVAEIVSACLLHQRNLNKFKKKRNKPTVMNLQIILKVKRIFLLVNAVRMNLVRLCSKNQIQENITND